MKNVTLSMPDDLLIKSREYAERHGTTLNDMIREYLKKTVSTSSADFESKLASLRKQIKLDTKNLPFDREELYKR